ncbi:MAG: hypothetical protein ACI9F2_000569 [Lysobacterales bacterium]|jgi:hypothetical protein
MWSTFLIGFTLPFIIGFGVDFIIQKFFTYSLSSIVFECLLFICLMYFSSNHLYEFTINCNGCPESGLERDAQILFTRTALTLSEYIAYLACVIFGIRRYLKYCINNGI